MEPEREKKSKPVRDYLTVSDVAILFHVSTKTVVRWANDGRLPYMSTLGGHRRFPRAEIEDLLAGRQHLPTNLD
ncbi:MAG: helix-turn-helix domain-containing protein [Acidimicrobiales bacterium]